jgi:3-hydroxyisobutyrate dehydrogenase-like beta-hydroxyacid dehydrogenase
VSDPRVIAVLGLGEAGSAIAADLIAAGATVRGYDPVAPPGPGVIAARGEADACAGADLVLSLTTAHQARAAMRSALPAVGRAAPYGDMNTASAGLKQQLAAMASQAGIAFADVAIMAPVPGGGLRTPMLVSGPAAGEVAGSLNALGGSAEVIEGPAGTAAARKLVRSVFYKGLAAAVTESLRAGRAAGCEDWLRANIAGELDAATAATLDRLEQGSITHAVRRVDEMTAVAALLGELGVPDRVTQASIGWLTQLAAENPVT